jgi:hypothetical protein
MVNHLIVTIKMVLDIEKNNSTSADIHCSNFEISFPDPSSIIKSTDFLDNSSLYSMVILLNSREKYLSQYQSLI